MLTSADLIHRRICSGSEPFANGGRLRDERAAGAGLSIGIRAIAQPGRTLDIELPGNRRSDATAGDAYVAQNVVRHFLEIGGRLALLTPEPGFREDLANAR